MVTRECNIILMSIMRLYYMDIAFELFIIILLQFIFSQSLKNSVLLYCNS